MFTNRKVAAKLDAEIIAALESLPDPSNPEYDAAIDRIAKLEKLRPDSTGPKPISWDTVLMVGANIFGVVWLARYESEHVIKSQSALRFVLKPK